MLVNLSSDKVTVAAAARATGAAINVGSAYRLFFDVVPLRGSSTEGLSGQYMIGTTDSYNAKVHRSLEKSNCILVESSLII
jgi:hypothetical protein